MKENLKCKICGYVLLGIIVLPNYPICLNCREYLEKFSHIPERSFPSEMRQTHIFGVTSTASILDTGNNYKKFNT